MVQQFPQDLQQLSVFDFCPLFLFQLSSGWIALIVMLPFLVSQPLVFFLSYSSERGLFFAFSWHAFLHFMLSATLFNGSSWCFLDHSVNESSFLEVSIELSFLVLPISYPSWNTIKLEAMNNKVKKNPFFLPSWTDVERYGLLL